MGEVVLDNGVGPVWSHKCRVRGRQKEILGQKRGALKRQKQRSGCRGSQGTQGLPFQDLEKARGRPSGSCCRERALPTPSLVP